MVFAGTSRGASGVDWANTEAEKQRATIAAMLGKLRERV